VYTPVRFNTPRFHFIQAVCAAERHDDLIVFWIFYACSHIPFKGVGRDGQKTGKDVQEHFKETLYAA
jgi:hypothetical protein